jgi:hypothetical protein
MNNLKTDVNSLITNAQTALNTLFSSTVPTPVPPTPTPTPPSTNVLLQDNFDTPYPFPIGTTSKNGLWICKYQGSGKVAFENGVLHMVPKAATNYANDSSGVGYETYACQVNSKGVFKDFQLDLDMVTNKQLRTGYSKYGTNQQGPQPWETAWVFFRFTDEPPKSNHHYYFIIRGDHCEFGKKDNAPNDTTVEQQIYLPRVADTKLVVGQPNHVTITAKGNKFVILVDGKKIVDYTDTAQKDPAKMSQGLLSFYTEDAETSYDNVKVIAI